MHSYLQRYRLIRDDVARLQDKARAPSAYYLPDFQVLVHHLLFRKGSHGVAVKGALFDAEQNRFVCRSVDCLFLGSGVFQVNVSVRVVPTQHSEVTTANPLYM